MGQAAIQQACWSTYLLLAMHSWAPQQEARTSQGDGIWQCQAPSRGYAQHQEWEPVCSNCVFFCLFVLFCSGHLVCLANHAYYRITKGKITVEKDGGFRVGKRRKVEVSYWEKVQGRGRRQHWPHWRAAPSESSDPPRGSQLARFCCSYQLVL